MGHSEPRRPSQSVGIICSAAGLDHSGYLDTIYSMRWLSHSHLLLNKNLALLLETPDLTLEVLCILIGLSLDLAKSQIADNVIQAPSSLCPGLIQGGLHNRTYLLEPICRLERTPRISYVPVC